MHVTLREVGEADLETLFEHQRQPRGNAMAAFPPRERAAFFAHWRTNVLGSASAVARLVLADGEIAGNIGCWQQGDRRLVGYWLDERFWGRGVATAALAALLREVPDRPLHALVAVHNAGSIRVLEKCGFVRIGREAGQHGTDEVDAFVYELR